MTAGDCATDPAETQPDPVTPLDAAAPLGQLRLPPCEVCQQPLIRKGGAVVGLAAAARRAAAVRHWRAKGSPPPEPPQVDWRLVHTACIDVNWNTTYRVPVERLRTDRQLLRSTIRVARKPWHRQTNWPVLVGRIIEHNGGG